MANSNPIPSTVFTFKQAKIGANYGDPTTIETFTEALSFQPETGKAFKRTGVNEYYLIQTEVINEPNTWLVQSYINYDI